MKTGCEAMGPGVTAEVLGVRGSLPAAGRSFMEYGGNTSCICVRYGGGVVCFDGGSGLPGLLDCLSGTPRLGALHLGGGTGSWPVGQGRKRC